MIRALYPEYIKKAYSAVPETAQSFKNEQKIWIDGKSRFIDLWLNGENGPKRSF